MEVQGRQDFTSLEGAVLVSVLRLGAVWLGLMLSFWAVNLDAETGTRRACSCGGVARWVETRAKTVLTLLGRVTYQRVYFHCSQCHKGQALGDQIWGLAHTRTSAGVKQLVAYLSASTIWFAVVAKNVCRTLCWPANWLSAKQVQRFAEPLGRRLTELEVAQVSAWWQIVTAGLSAPLEGSEGQGPRGTVAPSEKQDGDLPKRMYVQMDGISVRVRGTEGKGSDIWREVKVGAVFWAEAGRRASQLATLLAKVEMVVGAAVRVWIDRPKGAITYAAGLLPASEVGTRLYAEAIRRGLKRAEQVVILGDGARWIWKLAEEHFPGAIQILDFWHAKQRVWLVAHAVWVREARRPRSGGGGD